jgi:hypothetical protein
MWGDGDRIFENDLFFNLLSGVFSVPNKVKSFIIEPQRTQRAQRKKQILSLSLKEMEKLALLVRHRVSLSPRLITRLDEFVDKPNPA